MSSHVDKSRLEAVANKAYARDRQYSQAGSRRLHIPSEALT